MIINKYKKLPVREIRKDIWVNWSKWVIAFNLVDFLFHCILRLWTDNWPRSLSVSSLQHVRPKIRRNSWRPSFLLSIPFQKCDLITYSLTYRFTCDEHRAVVTTERCRWSLQLLLQCIVEQNANLGPFFGYDLEFFKKIGEQNMYFGKFCFPEEKSPFQLCSSGIICNL